MLLSNLYLLATAPSGVARLRELILTLAVQGKLLPQDPADEGQDQAGQAAGGDFGGGAAV